MCYCISLCGEVHQCRGAGPAIQPVAPHLRHHLIQDPCASSLGRGGESKVSVQLATIAFEVAMSSHSHVSGTSLETRSRLRLVRSSNNHLHVGSIKSRLSSSDVLSAILTCMHDRLSYICDLFVFVASCQLCSDSPANTASSSSPCRLCWPSCAVSNSVPTRSLARRKRHHKSQRRMVAKGKSLRRPVTLQSGASPPMTLLEAMC